MTQMCKTVIYLEQLVIVYKSSETRDPDMVPVCNLPGRNSCDWMECMWSITSHNISVQFLPCAQPQGVHIVAVTASGDTLVDRTFSQSRLMDLGTSTAMNITIRHISDESLGLEVKDRRE